MTRLPDIALTGKKRSGKNTVASYLVEAHGYVELALADPLRELAAALNPLVAPGLRYNEVLERWGYDEAKDRYPEVRNILQRLGTDAAKPVFGDDVWTELLAQRIHEVHGDLPIVVTDVRFPNEADRLRDMSFKVVRIVRAGNESTDMHISERALDDYEVNHTITNDGSISDLHDAAALYLVERERLSFLL